MIKPYKGTCNECGEPDKWIQNSKRVCIECVYKKSHNGMTQFEVAYNSQRGKMVSDYQKKKKVPKTRTKKPSGEWNMFLEIWQEREHRCEHCKMWLGDFPKAFMFSHRKGKGAHPELRLDKDNIDLFCWDCHYAYDHQGKEKFNQRKDMNT